LCRSTHPGPYRHGQARPQHDNLLIEHTLKQIEAMSALLIETADKISAALGYRG